MSSTAGRAESLMVLRLWIEEGGELRVRITTSREPGGQEVDTAYAASPAEVLAAVRAWLDSSVTAR